MENTKQYNLAKINEAEALIKKVSELNSKLNGTISEGFAYDSVQFYYTNEETNTDDLLVDLYDDQVNYIEGSINRNLSVNAIKKMKKLIDNFIAIDFEPLPSWEDGE